MSDVERLREQIKAAKKHRKKMKKEFGKVSEQYVEADQDLFDLKEFLEFELLHY